MGIALGRRPFRLELVAAAALTIACGSWAHAAPYAVPAVTASGSGLTHPPEDAIDGNLGTRWTCDMSAAPCWIRLDLGAVKSVGRVAIAWYDGTNLKSTFSIGVAGDDFNYQTVFSGTSAGGTSSFEAYSFPAVSGRYVKITVTDDSLHSGRARISEVKVAGEMTAAVAAPSSVLRDVFGILEKVPTAAGGKTWTSAHWANDRPRTIIGRDPDDPTGVSENRSDRAQLYVDGKGTLSFIGESSIAEPRLHLNGGSAYAFRNVEITFYYLKQQDFDVDWGGMVVGARSGPEGHSQSSQFCDAHTYYGRFRNDGTYDFEKELKHPASSARSGTNIWNGATDIPAGKWIGMKYLVYNVTVGGKPGVKLELYRDTTGGTNGGTWEKIGDTVDCGGWAPPQDGAACSYVRDYIPLPGGVIVLRNTGVIRESYKWMSAREITPPAP